MTSRIADMSQRKAARVVGFAFIIMAIVGVFAEGFVLQRLIVPGDAAETANSIMANKGLLRSGIVGLLIVLTLDVVVAWALYVLLKPVHKSLALLAAWFRLVYTAIKGTTLLILFIVLGLLSGADYLTVFETDQLHALVLPFLNGYSYGSLIGYVFFGLHLFVLGYLVFKSGYIPRILGVWLIFACFHYLINSFGNLLLPNYEAYKAISLVVGFATGFAELGLGLWLLFRGAKIPEMKP